MSHLPLKFILKSSDEEITSQIKIAISKRTGSNDLTEFLFNADADIFIDSITIRIGSLKDTIQAKNQSVFAKNKWYPFLGLKGVKPGQKWMFHFYGTLAETGLSFESTAQLSD